MWRAGGREDHYPPALIVGLGIALLITIAPEVHLVNQSEFPTLPVLFLQQSQLFGLDDLRRLPRAVHRHLLPQTLDQRAVGVQLRNLRDHPLQPVGEF